MSNPGYIRTAFKTPLHLLNHIKTEVLTIFASGMSKRLLVQKRNTSNINLLTLTISSNIFSNHSQDISHWWSPMQLHLYNRQMIMVQLHKLWSHKWSCQQSVTKEMSSSLLCHGLLVVTATGNTTNWRNKLWWHIHTGIHIRTLTLKTNTLYPRKQKL